MATLPKNLSERQHSVQQKHKKYRPPESAKRTRYLDRKTGDWFLDGPCGGGANDRHPRREIQQRACEVMSEGRKKLPVTEGNKRSCQPTAQAGKIGQASKPTENEVVHWCGFVEETEYQNSQEARPSDAHSVAHRDVQVGGAGAQKYHQAASIGYGSTGSAGISASHSTRIPLDELDASGMRSPRPRVIRNSFSNA